MGRRGEHSKEQLRSMAIEAAEKLVISEGLSGLTVRKVATQMGYTPGSLYTVFAHQDELILEVNGRTLDALNMTLVDAMASASEPRLQLQAVAAAYLQFALQHPHRWRLAFEHSLPQIATLPERFQTKVDAIYAEVAQVLQPMIPAKQLRLAAVALWSYVHGMCTLLLNDKLAQGGVASAEPLLNFAIENYWRGLMSNATQETV